MEIHSAGENSLIVYLGDSTSASVSARVQSSAHKISQALGDALIDLVPSYASLLVIYDPMQTDHFHVHQTIRTVLDGLQHHGDTVLQGNHITLPVYYSAESGEDLLPLADRCGLTPEDVIRIHSEQEYRVYAIGFAPGFAYLGEVDERIAAPRLSTPRQRVPRGAVAIADRQTAVYPAVSPGGWNLIGLCPVRMFDPDSDPTMPVAVGDIVRFEPVERDQFIALGGELL